MDQAYYLLDSACFRNQLNAGTFYASFISGTLSPAISSYNPHLTTSPCRSSSLLTLLFSAIAVMARNDRAGLGGLYAENMKQFGCGIAMYQPISGGDMCPPCAGYIDVSGNWNLVADLRWKGPDGQLQTCKNAASELVGMGYEPLENPPVKMEQLGIEWRPRTSRGVQQLDVGATGETPNIGLPVGANTDIAYKSNSEFGAVLIASKPITLTAYNNETLFRSWLRSNRARLYALHGAQLRRYGLWLVTTTYTSPRASITAWLAKNAEAKINLKVKANMLGDIGENLNYTDEANDQDWSNYIENDRGDGLVLFFDGIHVPALDWWWQGAKTGFKTGVSMVEKEEAILTRKRSLSSRRHPSTRESLVPYNKFLQEGNIEQDESIINGLWDDDVFKDEVPLLSDLWGDSPSRLRSTSRGPDSGTARDGSLKRTTSVSTPRQPSNYIIYDEKHPQPLLAVSSTSPPTRLSYISTTSASRARDPRFSEFETGPPAIRRHSLRRKTSSPSLRQPS